MSILEQLSAQRKELIAQGSLPEWFTTPGFQLFVEKYHVEGEDYYNGRARNIAKTAASKLPENLQVEYEEKFYQLIWKGWLSPSTPVLSNMGTNKGLSVSCFVAGTKVNTKDGLKNIEDLTVDDFVLTHENRYRRVIDTMHRNTDDLYELEFMDEIFVVTGNHPILTDKGWVNVSELNETHVILNIK